MEGKYRRNLLLLGAASLALALVFIVGSIIQSGQRSSDLGGIDQFINRNADVRRIIVNKDIWLEQQDDLWTVRSADDSVYNARSERVEDFLNGLLSIQFTRRVSREPEDLGTFGLQEGQTVELFDEENRLISRFSFGGLAELRDEQYFRIEDLPEIYAINANLKFYLDQSDLYWTDLRLWEDLADEPLTFYRIYADDTREDWHRDEEGTWLSSTDEEALPEVESAARSLLRLEGEDLVDSIPDDAQYLLSAGIETDKDRRLEIMIYSRQEEGSPEAEDSSPQYYVRSSTSEDSQIYVLPEWRYLGLTDF